MGAPAIVFNSSLLEINLPLPVNCQPIPPPTSSFRRTLSAPDLLPLLLLLLLVPTALLPPVRNSKMNCSRASNPLRCQAGWEANSAAWALLSAPVPLLLSPSTASLACSAERALQQQQQRRGIEGRSVRITC